MNKSLNNLNEIEECKRYIKEAEYILIGAGSGLSTAAGIEYLGKRFEENFEEFIEKYNFTDMYTSSFYNFKTEEEKWAYWAKHIYTNCTGMEGTKLYKEIFNLVKDKKYFVITTNVDEQFIKSGFDINKVFEIQGSYRYIQCAKSCHNKLYDDTEMVNKMISKIKNCKIPTQLVPKCPVCGGTMEVNLRKDINFVQDEKWYDRNQKYENFIEKAKDKKTILLEFGVGFNTPMIIRFPFEQMTYENKYWKLIRINKENSDVYLDIKDKTISISEDINKIMGQLGQV